MGLGLGISVDWASLVPYYAKVASAFAARVKADGGTVENTACLKKDLKALNPTPPTGYLLTDYPGAAAAYSLRLINKTYASSAIRVRRGADNAEQNIGFASKQLDTEALESFAGSGDAFVTTWYDQSGNGVNATQTNAAQQPKIVSSGSTILDNGKAAVQFDGTNDRLFGTDNGSLDNIRLGEFTYISVVKNTLTSGGKWNAIFTPSTSNASTTGGRGALAMQLFSSEKKLSFHNTWASAYRLAAIDITSIFNNQLLVFQTRDDVGNNGNGSGVTNSVNTLTASDTQSWTSFAGSQYCIGSQSPTETSSVEDWKGFIQEIVIYPTDQTSDKTPITTNINDFYSIY